MGWECESKANPKGKNYQPQHYITRSNYGGVGALGQKLQFLLLVSQWDWSGWVKPML